MAIDALRKLVYRNAFVRILLTPAIMIKRKLFNKYAAQVETINTISGLLYKDPVIKLAGFKGVFALDPHSHIFTRLALDGAYEPDLLQVITRYIDTGRDAIDVGANIGFFTVMLAKTLENGRVLSVEPTQNALQRLHRNITLNGIDDSVIVFEGVCSNASGSATINVIPGKEAFTSLGNMVHPEIIGEPVITQEVKSTTLDILVEEHSLNPGFIKVDVEGAEQMVFEGAQSVLSQNRPVILSELSDTLLQANGSSAMEVIKLIKQHDYDIFDPLEPSVQPGRKDFGDILCFPTEMNVRL